MARKANTGSLNQQLREARLQHRWSQLHVAERIGTTTNNVSRWELGQTMPGPYFRAKLCALFGKFPQELGLLAPEANEEQPPDLPPAHGAPALSFPEREQSQPLWSVPYPRNPFFTGRETLLEELHTRLHGSQTIAILQSHALYGLGGIGKTQLALEYAYRRAQDYTAVLWIAAETAESILASLQHAAATLELPPEQDQMKLVTAVGRWLSTHQDWLLIWDNVEDLDLLSQFLPPTRAGAILLTTRRRALGTFAVGLELAVLEPEEGGSSGILMKNKCSLTEKEKCGSMGGGLTNQPQVVKNRQKPSKIRFTNTFSQIIKSSEDP